MPNPHATLIDLETKFWQSMMDQKTDVALSLLCEPALMVSAHGAMKFDHAGYRRMAQHGSSTWVKTGRGWRCAMHTETPVPAR